MQWYYRLFEETQKGLKWGTSVEVVHGSLLALGELLRHTGEQSHCTLHVHGGEVATHMQYSHLMHIQGLAVDATTVRANHCAQMLDSAHL